MFVTQILVVDDFLPWQQLVSKMFESEPNLNIISFASEGFEAVQKAKELQPDVILMDVNLPTLNGIEAARQIRKVAPKSKILFVSTYGSVEIVEGALDTGASGYVVKTDAGKELVKAVKAVIQGKRYVSGTLKEVTPADTEDTHVPGREVLAWPSAPARPRKTETILCHEAQFYSDDVIYRETVTHFIGTALRAGNAAILLATKPHRDSVFQSLKAQGVDVDAAIQQGAYFSLDAADTLSGFMVNGSPDADRFLESFRNLIQSASNGAKAKHPRVAICGEGVALLWAEGKREAAIRLEQLGNILAGTDRVDILCAYPFSLLIQEDEHAFKSICAEHSAVYSA